MMNTSIQHIPVPEPRVYRQGIWVKLVTMTMVAGAVICASLLACANIAATDETDTQIVVSSSAMRAYPPSDVDPGGFGPRAGYGADDPGGPADPSAFIASRPEPGRVPAHSSKKARRSSHT